MVENGGTVVLGGIYQQTERNSTSKVPLLGDVPVLGYLFRTTGRTNDKTECDARGRVGGDQDFRSKPYPQSQYLLAALAAARSVDAGAVAAQCGENKARIPDAVYQARVSAVKASWRESGCSRRFMQGSSIL